MIASCSIVLICNQLEFTAENYRQMLGFRVVEHYDKAEKFAAAYRDQIEILLVQAAKEQVLSNRARYGAGYDAYLVPDSLESVRALHAEMVAKGVKIVDELTLTPYGSLEFSFSDCEGHLIGVGLIQNQTTFHGASQNQAV